MLNLLLFLIFLGSVLTVVGIVVGAFPALTNLEIEQHPKLREAKTKHALLFGKWQRRVENWSGVFLTSTSPMVERLRTQVRRVAHRVIVLERRYGFLLPKTKKKSLSANTAEAAHELLLRAGRELSADAFEAAEQTYIDVLRLDARNVEAYWGLVGVYRERRADREVVETLHFLTKLVPEDPEVWYELARQSQQMSNNADALEAAREAVALEAANPKYLDFLCEAAIVSGRRAEALNAFRKLEATNPENQKLKEFRQRMKGL